MGKGSAGYHRSPSSDRLETELRVEAPEAGTHVVAIEMVAHPIACLTYEKIPEGAIGKKGEHAAGHGRNIPEGEEGTGRHVLGESGP